MDLIFSDVHGNLEALEAVLAASGELNACRRICLGDLVGYGPDSLACLRESANWEWVLAGDFDRLLLDGDCKDWNPAMQKHIDGMRDQFAQAPDVAQLRAVLQAYKNGFEEHGVRFCHGTPRSSEEWIFPEDIYESQKLNRIAADFDVALFCGHSHVPGIFARRQGCWEFTQPVAGREYSLHGRPDVDKLIVTVGSVGQPRDEDPRACFVMLDENQFRFHRVEYNIEATIAKINEVAYIDSLHGERLLVGR